MKTDKWDVVMLVLFLINVLFAVRNLVAGERATPLAFFFANLSALMTWALLLICREGHS